MTITDYLSYHVWFWVGPTNWSASWPFEYDYMYWISGNW